MYAFGLYTASPIRDGDRADISSVEDADIIARISPFGREDAPITTSPLLRDSVMANAHSDEDVVADTSAEREKKKRPRRNWESVNVAITWNDVPSYVKELSRTNDHISYVGGTECTWCFVVLFCRNCTCCLKISHFSFDVCLFVNRGQALSSQKAFSGYGSYLQVQRF